MLSIKDPKFNFYLHKKSMIMKNHYKVNPIKVKQRVGCMFYSVKRKKIKEKNFGCMFYTPLKACGFTD